MAVYNKQTDKRIKLIVCDGDGTLISRPQGVVLSSWELLGVQYVKEEWLNTDAKYRPRLASAKPEERDEIYGEWARENAHKLKGFPVSKALQIQLPYTPGAQEYFTQPGIDATKAIISGGLDIVFDRVAEELGFEHCFCNTLGTQNGSFDGSIQVKVPLNGKPDCLQRLTEHIGGVENAEIMVVGDSYNDIPIFQQVAPEGLRIALNPTHPEVADAASFVIKDFTELHQYTEIR